MKKYTLIAWSFICAFVILLFTTRSSILFVCNNWDDANSYFTMGKGMMNGFVIYRDLYDQKGPFLYLLYGFAYLISKKSFFGVFIFEIIAATVFLYFAGKLIERKSSRNMAFVLVPVIGAAAYSSWSFYWGGAAEEFCLPLLMISLYYLDKLLCEEIEEKSRNRIFAVSGICAGVVAQVKYTMLGFFFAWFIIAFACIWMKSGFGTSVKMAIRFVIFAVIPSIPWLIYFLFTNSLDDWYRCYVYNNIFFYSQASDENYSFLKKIYEITKTLYWLIRDSFSYFIWIITGIILHLFGEKGILRRIALLFIFACTYFVIFIGGNKLAYYSIPLMVLAVPGVAYLGKLINSALQKRDKTVSGHIYAAVAALVMVISTVFAANNTMNAEYRKYSADDMWLLAAAKELSETDTLLEVNSIDPGLYTVTGIKPTCEYFQTNGIGLEKMFEEQKKYIKEGRTDFVLATDFEPEFIGLNYDLVNVYEYKETDHEEEYYLYKKRQ
ncbi:hypothetical protein D6856_06440 [Butyrivibrio sp. XB500-5]|uniref:hypothetical protein n=1 Tax=Butyrivibrio sp. XB500-5 TaxID=2364880 RepID=UPI000EA94758|nr:hypothetical protein [Butyrivibrio sp. XB500-5]RKM60689.1 hypothetical protein D6856_06440 [Butyrivibrio sp. XB500-5]